jgi:hypothetical protein
MRCGAPGVTRKGFEASDSIDESHRLVCTHRSNRKRAECRFAMGRLQFAKCFRAVFKLHHCLLGGRSACGDFFLPIEPLDWCRVIKGVWQSAHFAGYQDRGSHRFRAQPRSAHIVRPAGHRHKFGFLARDLGQARCVVERMQCARESPLRFLRFEWPARLRHEFLRLTQGIAGL